MNILLITNTYTPHVGGVARSVEAFAGEYRKRGHSVLIVAPTFMNMPRNEEGVFRVSAIQNFNTSDFSIALPFHQGLGEVLDEFKPDIVHSQHPFLLGMTAMRIARYRQLPLVFTHHTLYEQYTHYVPGDSPALKRFAIELATRYANKCDKVFAPSESIHQLLVKRGVTTPINIIPTGVCLEKFSTGNGKAVRKRLGIPDDAYVVGHLGRLAPEKNLEFLSQAVIEFMSQQDRCYFLVIGTGPAEVRMHSLFRDSGLADRLHVLGILTSQDLTDALHAMNVFAFASRSETQGMVLTEAMAAGLPVVALDAPGVREVVRDGYNGRLLKSATISDFSMAIQWMFELPGEDSRLFNHRAYQTAEEWSLPHCADKALACYEALSANNPATDRHNDRDWEDVLTWLKTEWYILKSLAEAGDIAIGSARIDERDSGE